MSQPFSDTDVDRVASDHGVPPTALREAATAVQTTLAGHSGRTADGLVYEWRQAFRHDPLVERTPAEWILRVPERAWTDVLQRADVDDAVADALLALHETRVASLDSQREDGAALVISRD